MIDRLKDKLEEVISLANACPEKYQLKCFEVLLEALVKPQIASLLGPPVTDIPPAEPQVDALPKVLSEKGVSTDELSRVYLKDGGSYNIIVGGLKAKPTAKKQFRLGLLIGMKNLMETGNNATVLKDALVELCKLYSVYDSANFATNMKNNRQSFMAKGKDWVLTVPGQQSAAELIKELAE